MNCSLYVLRHAKSDWEAEYGEDHERPLAPRGVKAARTIGRFIASIRQPPDLVLCSTAERARRTVDIASKAGDWFAPTDHSAELYAAEPRRALELVEETGDDVGRLLVASHEPFCSSFLSALVGGGRFEFPTAALARVDFDVESWRAVRAGEGRLRWLVTPKILGA